MKFLLAMYTALTLALVTVACVGTDQPGSQTVQAVGTGYEQCNFNPALFGGVPDDDQVDREAIQLAVDLASVSGGTVCLGPGEWRVDKAPLGSRNRFASIAVNRPGVTIAGVGSETVLRQVGDQGGQASWLIAVDPGASNFVVRDLTLDTSEATGTEEHNHTIATTGICEGAGCLPIENLEITGVTFKHVRSQPLVRKGDCIALMGNFEHTPLRRVRIHDNDFQDCDRSNILLQRNVHDVVIADNTMYCSRCDSNIDSEPSDLLIYNVLITGNSIVRGPGSQGDFAVTLARTRGGIFANNIVTGGAVQLFATGDYLVQGNRISATVTSDVGAVDIRNVCSGGQVVGNTLRREGPPGPVIKIEPHGPFMCRELRVSDNTIFQSTPGPAIYAAALSDSVISENFISYSTPAPGVAGVHIRSTHAAFPIQGLRVSDNHVVGPVGAGLMLQASPAPITNVSVFNTGTVVTE